MSEKQVFVMKDPNGFGTDIMGPFREAVLYGLRDEQLSTASGVKVTIEIEREEL